MSPASLARCLVLVLLLARVGDAAPIGATEPLVLVYEGSRLSVRQVAPVPYSDLASMLAALPHASLSGRYAIVLFRDSPRQLVGYVLVVQGEGTLSLGSQLHEWNAGDRGYRFLKGELIRSYPPLEGRSPWTWLVTIPISRELQASLVIRAVNHRWPVESVSISAAGQRTH